MLKIDFGLVYTAINLLVLYILLKLFLFKPIHKVLEERQRRIDQSFAEADEAKASAEALERQHSDSLQGIEEEKRQVMAEARKKASAEYDRIVDSANTKAAGIVEKAKTEAAAQKEDMLQKARGEITELVVNATARVAGVSSEGDSSLYDDFLKKAGESDDQTGA